MLILFISMSKIQKPIISNINSSRNRKISFFRKTIFIKMALVYESISLKDIQILESIWCLNIEMRSSHLVKFGLSYLSWQSIKTSSSASPGTLAPHSATDDRAIKMVKISKFVEYVDNTLNIYLFLALIYFLLFGKNGIILNWDSMKNVNFKTANVSNFPLLLYENHFIIKICGQFKIPYLILHTNQNNVFCLLRFLHLD